MGQRRRSIAIAMAMGKEDWGTGARATEQCCNRTVIAMGQWGNDRSNDSFISGSMSCIVVVENVQNVWTAIIHEVVPAIKTGPF
jgi:hypothetical protein